MQPSQPHVKVGEGSEDPVHVKTDETLDVEGLTQIGFPDAVNVLVGGAFTVTKTVVTGEVQEVAPGLTTFRVKVLVPAEFQLIE